MKDTFEHKGRSFSVEYLDDDLGPPWIECDGCGIVSDWTSRDKRPGESILCSDGRFHRYYDVQATIAKATKESWGLSAEALDALRQTQDHEPTCKEIIAEAVERDFEYLHAWCNDQWRYVCLHVTLLDENEELTDYEEYLGGVECDWSKSWHKDCARELADQLLHRWNVEHRWEVAQNLGVVACA